MSTNALVPELSVCSISNSLRFYAETLGFHILYQRPEDGFAFIAIGGAQIMLDQIDKGRTFDQATKGVLGLGLNLQINVSISRHCLLVCGRPAFHSICQLKKNGIGAGPKN